MSRCICCNDILSSSELVYKHKESKLHDGLCVGCRDASFNTQEHHDYAFGMETESLIATIIREGCLRIEEIPSNIEEYLDD